MQREGAIRIQTPGGIVPPLQERGPVPRLLGMELLRATKRQFVNDLINLTLTSLDMVGVLGGDREVGLAAGPTQGLRHAESGAVTRGIVIETVPEACRRAAGAESPTGGCS